MLVSNPRYIINFCKSLPEHRSQRRSCRGHHISSQFQQLRLWQPYVARPQDILFQKYLVADDNEGFIKNILKLKNDPQFYSQYQNYSYEISQYYSKEHVKEMWKEFYLDIAKKRIYK